jgi:hypothetical protein
MADKSDDATATQPDVQGASATPVMPGAILLPAATQYHSDGRASVPELLR